jgi:hypothetical protein
MQTRTTFYLVCQITGNKEEWEKLETKTQPAGRGGQVSSFSHKNCMNFQCKHRGTPSCPYNDL